MTIASFTSLLGEEFVQNALVAGAIAAIVAGIVGPFVVVRNMAFAVHGIAELGFTGAAGALLIGLDPILGVMVGSLGVAGLIGALGVRSRERDSVIGVILAFGLGLGVLFITLYDRYATGAFALLFGTITGVSRDQLLLLGGCGLAVVVAVALIYRPLLFASVDPDVAEARGVPVRALSIGFLAIMAFAEAEAIQVVGVLLILSLMIAPAAAAGHLTASPGATVLLSVALALLASIGGILLSLVTPYPASVFTTGISFAAYVLARLFGSRLRSGSGRLPRDPVPAVATTTLGPHA
ncbi:MAG: zinc/manganese transport system permease protein [Thermoleophilaceae bacterium]|jgi:zinc/manganese transport system permease protein|nr:zinc/manganese transport system permease protein [Thermoleophilaceae bacterium]